MTGSDYTDLLAATNFKTLSIPITPTSGVYDINYAFLTAADVNSASYGTNTDYYSGTSFFATEFGTALSSLSAVEVAFQSITETNGAPVGYDDYYSDVANISFAQKPDTDSTVAIQLGTLNDPSGHFFSHPQTTTLAGTIPDGFGPGQYGDIWLNTGTQSDGVTPVIDWTGALGGSIQFETLIHELGHALGLQHPSSETNDSPQYTIMSPDSTAFPGMSTVYLSGLQIDDIVAIQSIYGANYSTRGTDTIYGMGFGFGATASSEFVYTIWDGGGTNIIDATGYTYSSGNGAYIDLRQGAFSSIGVADSGVAQNNVAVAYGALIQNAIGTDTGNDALVGNAWNNVLYGAGGNDSIYADGITKDATVGPDWNATNGSAWNNSNDSYLASGSSVHDVLIGGSGDDVLYAGVGSDLLHGGYVKADIDNATLGWATYWDAAGQFTGTNNVAGAALSDIAYTSDGTDTADYSRLYLSNADGTQSISAGTHGIDVTYNNTEEATVQKGTLDTSGVGSDGTDRLFSIESVVGTAGDDNFYGANGTVGTEPTLWFQGGAGNDTYTFNVASDYGAVRIDDTSGSDTVNILNPSDFVANTVGLDGDTYIEISFDNGVLGQTWPEIYLDKTQIDAGTSIDRIVFEQSGSQFVFDAKAFIDALLALPSGNHTIDDVAAVTGCIITANADGSILGGTNGPDNMYDNGYSGVTLSGGPGDDTYHVDNSSTIVADSSSADINTVLSTVGSYTLPTNVDHLMLTGTGAQSGTGNSDNNVITGNNAGDTINGGAGDDTLVGGTGNDLYLFHVGSGHDVVTDSGGTSDVISFDSTVSVSSVTYDEVGTSLDINYGTSGDTIAVTGYFGGTGSIEQIKFSDGTIHDSSYIDSHLANVFTGTSGNDTLTGTTGADIMQGLTGNDTYIVDNVNDVVVENPGEGTDTIETSVSYTLPDNVEVMYATEPGVTLTGGAGNDILYGYAVNSDQAQDTLSGGQGNDTLYANTGYNVLAGGLGDDTYYVDTTAATVVENSGEGTDTVITPYSYTLGANVENLTLTNTAIHGIGTGNELNNVITGSSAGYSTLDGGTGVDTLIGNGLHDIFIVNNTADLVVAGSETDTIKSSVTWDMSSAGHNNDLDTLYLTGSANINGTGNSLNNVIVGNSGIDTLDGGAGADTLFGSSGDTYIVDNTGDIVNDSGGSSVIQSSISFNLSDSTHNYDLNVNNLTLTAANLSSTANNNGDTIIGAYGGDTLTGGSGDDVLEVKSGTAIGGAGDDYLWNVSATSASTLEGGTGDDTFISRNAGDYLVGGSGNDVYYLAGPLTTAPVEASGGGTDTIHENDSFVSLSDTGYTNIENLYLDLAGLNGTLIGNTLANILSGDAYANSLSGLGGIDTLYGNGGNDTLDGGTGADTMYGGTGDDTYFVDNTGDVVGENSSEGTDTVLASVNGYTLAANVENLTLTNSVTLGTGNSLDNVIVGSGNSNETVIGGAGNDTLDTGGTNSAGHTLEGGTGNDTYIVYSSAHDVVVENAGEGTDTIQSSVSWDMTSIANVENLTLTGTSGLNGTGNSLDNVIIGNSGGNSLSGGSGNDTLDGGNGLDTLTGGAGSDTFVFHGATAFNNIDVVTDFKTTDNDKIDISDVITGYHSGLNIDHFVEFVTSGANTKLEVDTSGGGSSYTQIATLNSITGLSVDTLVASGELVV